MKFSLILGEEYEGEVVIYAKEENATVSAIRAICEKEEKNIVGYSDGGIYTLSPYEIDCFVSEKDQLFAYTAVGKLRIKSRLLRGASYPTGVSSRKMRTSLPALLHRK